jgi:hypothetical protein
MNAHTAAKTLVTAILANTDTYPISSDDAGTRNTLVQLAQYTRLSLEDENAKGLWRVQIQWDLWEVGLVEYSWERSSLTISG